MPSIPKESTLRRQITPSMAVAVLALFVSLGGTAVAAGHYLVMSTSQIKPSVLRAIRGTPGHLVVVHGPLTTVEPSSIGESEASCPAGYDVVSGGYSVVLGVGADINQDEPLSPHSWGAGVSTRLSSEHATVSAVALCAPTGQVIAASAEDRADASRLRITRRP